MRKTFLILLLLTAFYILHVTYVYAVKSSPTPTKSEAKETEVISDLKERIASRVAQLKLVEKRGVIGTVSDISDTQISITDSHRTTKFIDVDELTKFSSPSVKGSFGISDITKGSSLGVLGLYNKQSKRILARYVDVIFMPTFNRGTIISIDSKNYTFEIMLDTGERKMVDVENITKTLSYSKASGLARAGFSKIKEQEHIFVVGFLDKKDKNRIVASRIILFPEIPKNPKINIPENAIIPQETTIPSTGSGKKLTPITR